MISRATTVAASPVAFLIFFAACSNCGGGGSAPSSVDANDSSLPDTGTFEDRAVTDAQPAGYSTEGWVHLDFDPQFDCGFYAAPDKTRMPQPIEWQPCESVVAATGMVCRDMKFNWAPPTGALAGSMMAPASDAWVDSDGKAWLAFSRVSGGARYDLVAEADGPVHTAIRQPAQDCYLTTASLREGKVVFNASRRSRSGGKETVHRSGAIGGSVDAVPSVLDSATDGIVRAYIAGAASYFWLPDRLVRAWAPASSPTKVVVEDPGEISAPQFVGDSLLFQVGNLQYERIKAFSVADGARDLVSFGNDVSKQAADIGTDGKDMVWTEASGRSAAGEPWAAIDIVTSPFTTDSAKVQKRRLRSESGTVGAAPFIVGCGYAAHAFSSTRDGTGQRVVRLSDGRSWRLTTLFGTPRWQWMGVLAITCEELFIGVSLGSEFQVARVRLDSLGTGEAAD